MDLKQEEELFSNVELILEFQRVQSKQEQELFDTLCFIRDRVVSTETRLDQMDLRFDAMDKRFDAMDNRFDGLERRLDHDLDRRKQLEVRVTTLEKKAA